MTKLPEPIPNTDLTAEPISDAMLEELERQLKSDVLVRTQVRPNFLGLLARMRQAEADVVRLTTPTREALAEEVTQLQARIAPVEAERDAARARAVVADLALGRALAHEDETQDVLAHLRAEVVRLQAQARLDQTELENLRREVRLAERADATHATMRGRAERATAEMTDAQQQAAELSGGVVALRRDLETTRQQAEASRAAVTASADALRTAQIRQQVASARLSETAARSARESQVLDTTRARVAELEAQQAHIATLREQHAAHVQALRTAEEALRRVLADLVPA